MKMIYKQVPDRVVLTKAEIATLQNAHSIMDQIETALSNEKARGQFIDENLLRVCRMAIQSMDTLGQELDISINY